MLYNTRTEMRQKPADCLKCPYFDRVYRKCNGFGKICFEVDRTNTLIDPVTGLAYNYKEEAKK